jgi:hypothetical protein
MTLPSFSIQVHQNPYQPVGSREVHAIVEVRSSGGSTGEARAVQAAEVIMVDTSGSMDFPGSKIKEAIRATKAAVDALPDGTLFAVVSGTAMATMVYPYEEKLAVADNTTRRAAKRDVDRLRARGGTAIGAWLSLANRLFEPYPNAVKHAILLTDGKNESESAQDFEAAIDAARGVFNVDCRGIGTDWNTGELLKISSALLGSCLLIRKADQLVEDFASMMADAVGKQVTDVALRVRTPGTASVKLVKQVRPSTEDLTGRRTDSGTNMGDYPTPAWGEEERHYHVALEVQPAGLDERIRPGLVSLVLTHPDGSVEELTKAGVFAEWTEDEALSLEINPEVAFHTGRAEIAEDLKAGFAARDRNDLDEATAKLGRALARAEEMGDEQTAKLIGKFVEVEPDTGTIVMRGAVDKADEMDGEIYSHTFRLKGA